MWGDSGGLGEGPGLARRAPQGAAGTLGAAGELWMEGHDLMSVLTRCLGALLATD